MDVSALDLSARPDGTATTPRQTDAAGDGFAGVLRRLQQTDARQADSESATSGAAAADRRDNRNNSKEPHAKPADGSADRGAANGSDDTSTTAIPTAATATPEPSASDAKADTSAERSKPAAADDATAPVLLQAAPQFIVAVPAENLPNILSALADDAASAIAAAPAAGTANGAAVAGAKPSAPTAGQANALPSRIAAAKPPISATTAPRTDGANAATPVAGSAASPAPVQPSQAAAPFRPATATPISPAASAPADTLTPQQAIDASNQIAPASPTTEAATTARVDTTAAPIPVISQLAAAASVTTIPAGPAVARDSGSGPAERTTDAAVTPASAVDPAPLVTVLTNPVLRPPRTTNTPTSGDSDRPNNARAAGAPTPPAGATSPAAATSAPTLGNLSPSTSFAALLAPSADAAHQLPAAVATVDNASPALDVTRLATAPRIDAATVRALPEPAAAVDEPTAHKSAPSIAPDGTTATPGPMPDATRAAATPTETLTHSARPIAHAVAEQVAVHLTRAAADGNDRLTIKLVPAELGRIEVRMEIGPDGHVQAVFAADRPQTLELLQRDSRTLEQALQSAGLSTDAGSLSFNLRQQSQQSAAAFAAMNAGAGNASDPDAMPAVAVPPIYAASPSAAGRLDIRV